MIDLCCPECFSIFVAEKLRTPGIFSCVTCSYEGRAKEFNVSELGDYNLELYNVDE